MRRCVSLLLSALLLLFLLGGCHKMPTVDKSVKPGEALSQYNTLTGLYGTPWRDVLEKLNIDMQELNVDGLNHVEVPLQENYAGLEFNTALRFGKGDAGLIGVENTITYQYPEEEGKLLQDIVALNRQLIADFGPASDTSYLFNWTDKMLGEKWNRDIAYWQDRQVLKRLLDEGYSGRLLLWDLTSVAGENVKKANPNHSLSVNIEIRDGEGTATVKIYY